MSTPDQPPCEHEYAEQYYGLIIEYTCRKCGDTYERDIS